MDTRTFALALSGSREVRRVPTAILGETSCMRPNTTLLPQANVAHERSCKKPLPNCTVLALLGETFCQAKLTRTFNPKSFA